MNYLSDSLRSSMMKGMTVIRVALTREFGDARLSKNDLLAARDWIKSQESGSGLFVPHEENKFTRTMQEKSDAWTVAYYDQQMTDLKNDFSEKRFLHVLEIREYLRKKGEAGFKPQPKPPVGITGQPPRKSPGSAKFGKFSVLVLVLVLVCWLVWPDSPPPSDSVGVIDPVGFIAFSGAIHLVASSDLVIFIDSSDSSALPDSSTPSDSSTPRK
jgi:hypothetical protein